MKPPVDDHVLLAVDDGDEAVPVHHADIAGEMPAGTADLGGRLGILVVAGADQVALDADFAGNSALHLVAIIIENCNRVVHAGSPDGLQSPVVDRAIAVQGNPTGP